MIFFAVIWLQVLAMHMVYFLLNSCVIKNYLGENCGIENHIWQILSLKMFFFICNYVPNVAILRSSNKVKSGNLNQIKTYTTGKVRNINKLMVPFVVHFFGKSKSKSDVVQLTILFFRVVLLFGKKIRTIINSHFWIMVKLHWY